MSRRQTGRAVRSVHDARAVSPGAFFPIAVSNVLSSVLPVALLAAVATLVGPNGVARADATGTDGPVHALAVFGEPKYGPDFAHFDYASPDAVPGGRAVLWGGYTFDSLNPFILKGQPAFGVEGNVFDTLTVRSLDEPFAVYGLLAESIAVPPDRGSVTFRLRPEARWHDGEPVTAEDVVWTYRTIMSEGHPKFRSYYADVESAEALDERTVRFDFREGSGRELPLVIGQLAVLPKHHWEGREFASGTLEPPLGSGPYRVGRVDTGRSVALERVEDYWGRELAVNVGRDNFGTLRYDYYRDSTVIFEAFKAGDIDIHVEYISKNWATGYDFPALAEGRVIREEIPDRSIPTIQGVIFNLRKPKYADPRVREALGLAFDFEWMNENLFFGAYARMDSYFQNSEMRAGGLPEGLEREVLESLGDAVPPAVFTEAFEQPETDGSGNLRANYREALALFREAGWEVRGGKMTNVETGEVFEMEWLIRQQGLERIALAWAKALERLGIRLAPRIVDSAQFEKRLEDFDFDVTTQLWLQTRSPGREQFDYWHSSHADERGSRNVMGVADPAVDALVERLGRVESREEQVAVARALDRVLLHGRYALLQYYSPVRRLAWWDRFVRPETLPVDELGIDFWWVRPEAREASTDSSAG